MDDHHSVFRKRFEKRKDVSFRIFRNSDYFFRSSDSRWQKEGFGDKRGIRFSHLV